MSGRLYFQENVSNGFGTSIGYYENGKPKKYIWQMQNEKKIKEYIDDQKFYSSWNAILAPDLTDVGNVTAAEFAASPPQSIRYEKFEARAHQFEYYNLIYPVVKAGLDSIAFFDFYNDVLEIMNPDGKIINTIPISFHKNTSVKTGLFYFGSLTNGGWRWGNTILVDDFSHSVYTLFLNNGMVKLYRIDLKTGNLVKTSGFTGERQINARTLCWLAKDKT